MLEARSNVIHIDERTIDNHYAVGGVFADSTSIPDIVVRPTVSVLEAIQQSKALSQVFPSVELYLLYLEEQDTYNMTTLGNDSDFSRTRKIHASPEPSLLEVLKEAKTKEREGERKIFCARNSKSPIFRDKNTIETICVYDYLHSSKEPQNRKIFHDEEIREQAQEPVDTNSKQSKNLLNYVNETVLVPAIQALGILHF